MVQRPTERHGEWQDRRTAPRFSLLDGAAHRTRILTRVLPNSRPWMSKVSGFPSPGLGCPLESGSQVSTIFVLGSAKEIVQGCGESEPCPSVVSTLRYQHRGNPPGKSPSTHRPAGNRTELPPPPPLLLATGPPAFEVKGRWQPDQRKIRIRRTSANVWLLLTWEPRQSWAQDPNYHSHQQYVRSWPTPLPSSPQQVLPLTFLCWSQKPKVASLVVGICLSLVNRDYIASRVHWSFLTLWGIIFLSSTPCPPTSPFTSTPPPQPQMSSISPTPL